jgi:hypothetical protein
VKEKEHGGFVYHRGTENTARRSRQPPLWAKRPALLFVSPGSSDPEIASDQKWYRTLRLVGTRHSTELSRSSSIRYGGTNKAD